jgi:PAS domain S-box-containing protein
LVSNSDYHAFDPIPEAVLVADGHGSIVFASGRAAELFGYEPGELVGLRIEALVPERHRQRHESLRRAFSAAPAVRPMGSGREVVALRKDGQEFPAEIALGPTGDGDCVVALVRDITAPVATRDELEGALAEVERLKDRLQSEAEYLRQEVKSTHNFEEILGSSDPMLATLRKVEQVAPTDSTVLIVGETGTGKELLARAVHARSKRRDRPLIKIDCTTLPSGLVESELFGHTKGAFTGALESKAGRFELANGGTIFLDEIGELPLDLQAKLLRVLQDGEYEPLGSKSVRKADVRIIAASNRDLRQEMAEGRFRSDLYYRLSVVLIETPPLRERREDIPLLVSYFVERSCASAGKRFASIAQTAMDELRAYDWPGNIRELQNVIERAVVLSPPGRLTLQQSLGDPVPPPRTAAGSLDQDLHSVERSRILGALQESGWRVKGDGNAASRLGLKPSTLQSRMKRLGITRP